MIHAFYVHTCIDYYRRDQYSSVDDNTFDKRWTQDSLAGGKCEIKKKSERSPLIKKKQPSCLSNNIHFFDTDSYSLFTEIHQKSIF